MAWHWMQGTGAPWGFGMMTMGLFWVALLAVLVAAVVALQRRSPRSGDGSGRDADDPREILRRRYARGEIDGAEFDERMRHLS